MGTAFDIIGLFGSFIISAGLVPQLSKVYRTKSATDISYSFLAMYNVGLALIVTYGIGEGLWPVFIPCSLEFLGALALLTMKLMYHKNVVADEEVAKYPQGEVVSTPCGRYSTILTPK